MWPPGVWEAVPMTSRQSNWSAPVRFAEVDRQNVVFNSHYLLYCDEAMGAFCDERGLRTFAEVVQLITTTLTWSGPARWGDVIEVDVSCAKLGRTSLTMHFDVRAGGRPCCVVDTVYVFTGTDGAPAALSDEIRAAVTG